MPIVYGHNYYETFMVNNVRRYIYHFENGYGAQIWEDPIYNKKINKWGKAVNDKIVEKNIIVLVTEKDNNEYNIIYNDILNMGKSVFEHCSEKNVIDLLNAIKGLGNGKSSKLQKTEI